MNLVKQIMDQLSGDTLGQLSSLLGTDAETTERAASAAVPSLLSGLAGMMSHDDSAKKLTNMLGGMDTSGLGNIAQMLGGNAGTLLNKGTSMLGSLFDDSMVSGIASTLSRFSGLNANVVKSLLAYLLPLVLGKVAAQWKNQGGTTQALKSLFADQRDNIINSTPPGFSLADIPNLSGVHKPVHSPNRNMGAEPETVGSVLRWLLPMAVALLVGFFLWQFMSRQRADQAKVVNPAETAEKVTTLKPVMPDTIAIPDLASVRTDVKELFRSLDTAFSEIRDASSAESAMPTLKKLNAKIDTVDQMLSRLPADNVTTLRPLIEEQAKITSEKANVVSSIKGIDPQLKTLIQEIVAKLTKWISTNGK